jgi:penicillin-binding protein 1A
LYRSINLVSIRVLLEVGAGKVLDHVGRFGFDTRSFPRNTQLAIGGGTMTVAPLDMSRAYAVLANGGHLVEPNIIDRIVDQRGEPIYLPPRVEVCRGCDSDQDPRARAELPQDSANSFVEPSGLEEFTVEIPQAETQREIVSAPQVIDERNAFIMDSMLKDVIKRGTGRRARSIGRTDLAAKQAPLTMQKTPGLMAITKIWSPVFGWGSVIKHRLEPTRMALIRHYQSGSTSWKTRSQAENQAESSNHPV